MLMSTTCPKCSGVLEEGHMLDPADGTMKALIWAEGHPPSGDATGDGRKYRTQAYRCMSCGYTELYSEEAL